MDDALRRLEREDPLKGQLIEMRYFGGMTAEESSLAVKKPIHVVRRELRLAQAQLVGWLEGLFHGIQTALFAQQMAARAQLEQMRQGALPPGIGKPGHGPGHPSTGQYL